MDPTHWYRRVLPVSALAVAVGALLALAVPSVRDEVELSASHQPQEYVALSFARGADGTVPVCTRTARGDVSVAFAVDSGLRETETLRYVVTVGEDRRAGTVTVDPGGSTSVTQVLQRPRGRHDVTVQLPDADREVRAHCGGRTR